MFWKLSSIKENRTKPPESSTIQSLTDYLISCTECTHTHQKPYNPRQPWLVQLSSRQIFLYKKPRIFLRIQQPRGLSNYLYKNYPQYHISSITLQAQTRASRDIATYLENTHSLQTALKNHTTSASRGIATYLRKHTKYSPKSPIR